MLEKSYGLKFFLKSPKRKGDTIRYVHVRITVDGVPKDASTKRKWDVRRWDQESERATGFKDDAKTLNFFLDSLVTNINRFKTEMFNSGVPITASLLIDFVNGNHQSRIKVLEEFQKHNEEMAALVKKGEYATGTYDRYVTARSHVQEFIQFKYKRDDLEFRELNYEFVKGYEFYLKTVRNCANNTTLKYISNFRKIVSRAIANKYIASDPFILFKGKKDKIKKKPLTTAELYAIENKVFSTERLSVARDIFIFQCYTGLAYADVFKLKKEDIKKGEDGNLWIMTERQKTGSSSDIPLLPKALSIMEKYKNDPLCIKRGSVLPVRSNQKMNEYLKEIQNLCSLVDLPIVDPLNNHRARRTFASTIALKNGVPIHVVRKMLGHQSVKQTEEYAITEQEQVSREMMILRDKLRQQEESKNKSSITEVLERLENELKVIKSTVVFVGKDGLEERLSNLQKELNEAKSTVL
jgi:integrase